MKKIKKPKTGANKNKESYVIINALPIRKLNDEFPDLMTQFDDFPVYVSDACWQQITSHPEMTSQEHVLEIIRSWAYSKMEPVEPGINAIDPYFYITEMTGSPSDGVLIFPALSFVKATAEELKQKIGDGTLETELKQRFDDMPDYWFPSKQLGFHESKGGIVR